MHYNRACISVVVVVVAIGRIKTLSTKAQCSRKWGVVVVATRFLPKLNINKALMLMDLISHAPPNFTKADAEHSIHTRVCYARASCPDNVPGLLLYGIII